MELTYNDGQVKIWAVAYEGASADGKSHTVHTKDGSKFVVRDSNLQLLIQSDFANIPNTPLDYKHEVGTSLTLPEAVQQALMSWNHRLYHLSFLHII